MEISPKPKKASRFKIGRIATAVAFALVICSFGVGPARAADDHRGGGGNRGGGEHRGGGNDHRGGGGDRGYHGGEDGGHWGGGYYAPGPDYYVAPEPYGYYGPAPCYGPDYNEDCGPPPPSGITLFFGF
jgi:uncharacterized membrane protein